MRLAALDSALTSRKYSVYLSAMSIAVLAAIVIVGVQHLADTSRRMVVQLTRVEVAGFRVYAAEQNAVTGFQFVDQAAPRIREAQRDLVENERMLDIMSNHADDLASVRDAFDRYNLMQYRMYGHLVNERNGAAMVASVQADEEWKSLLKEIGTASVRYGHRATQATWAASVGILLTLVAAALGTAFMFYRAERARDRLLEAEQSSLKQSEARFRALVQNADDAIAILSEGGSLKYISPSAERIWGWEISQLLKHSYQEFVHGDDLARAREMFRKCLTVPSEVQATELKLINASGVYRDAEVILNNLVSVPGIEGVVITYRDITERKISERRLHDYAYCDPLTGLANRRRFMGNLNAEILAPSGSRSPFAVYFVDVDNFKVVNDSLGHEVGDELLRVIAERLIGSVGPTDLVARLGGDEFTLLVRSIESEPESLEIAAAITKACCQPVRLAEMDLSITVSIGIAFVSSAENDAEVVLRNADIAMYHAKRSGRNASKVYLPTMSEEAMERLELEAEMRTGLELGQFVVHYQPILDLETGHIGEIEALVRWNHPSRGLIAPARFIPLAEECGLIVPIGWFVMGEAFRLSNDLHNDWGDRTPTISVNLSGRQLQLPSIIDDLRELVKRHGAVPERIKIEITESVTMREVEQTIAKLHALKQMGFKLAVDDFGTGYSSMAYLASFPLDTLKIDRSFVQRLNDKSEDHAIVQAIVTLASALHLSVTAEGIETESQLEVIREIGCSHGQGYLFDKPIPEAEIVSRISASIGMQSDGQATRDAMAPERYLFRDIANDQCQVIRAA